MARGWTIVSVVFLLVAAMMIALYWLDYIESQGIGYWIQFVLMVLIGFVLGSLARVWEEKDRFQSYVGFVRALQEAQEDG